MNTIIQSPKKTMTIEEESARLEKEMENLDVLENEVSLAREKASKRTKELNDEILTLNTNIESKEKEVESLSKKDSQLTTTIGVALMDIEKQRTELEERIKNLNIREVKLDTLEKEIRNKIQVDQEEINKQKIEVENGIAKNKKKENEVSLLAARLEEYKGRLLRMGEKRNGGIEVPLQD